MPVGDDAVITHISTPGKPATQNAWLHPSWKVWDGPLAQSSYYADEELFLNCSLCKNVSPNIANCMDKNKGPNGLWPPWALKPFVRYLYGGYKFYFLSFVSKGDFFSVCP